MLIAFSPAKERRRMIEATIANIEATRGQLWPMIGWLVAVRDCPDTAARFNERMVIELEALSTAFNSLLYSGSMLRWHAGQLSQQYIMRAAGQVRGLRCSPTYQKYLGMLAEARAAKPMRIEEGVTEPGPATIDMPDPWSGGE
jgi:hypothetical protein